MEHPRLRDGKRLQTNEPYPINQLPDNLIVKIGGYLVHLLYVGRKDLSGADWGDAFADAIGGKHLDSPIGIADVVLDKMAWSMKTVKNTNPFSARVVRLTSGRCSPDYSYGITDPHKDIQKNRHRGSWNMERKNKHCPRLLQPAEDIRPDPLQRPALLLHLRGGKPPLCHQRVRLGDERQWQSRWQKHRDRRDLLYVAAPRLTVHHPLQGSGPCHEIQTAPPSHADQG